VTPSVVCLSLGFALFVLLAPHAVNACGVFSTQSEERRPSLSYEQSLILYDPKTEREHFVREVVFRGGPASFGFVVPTPTRPEVAKVEVSPFRFLRESFPFEAPPPPDRSADLGSAIGGGAGGGLRGVTVLQMMKVGSFTSFVLAADDQKALAHWLENNGLASTKEADVWLAHYLRMKSYYVAMRYDPSPSDEGPRAELKAETIRISFSTPAPYYPYFEPKPPATTGEDGGHPKSRLFELWLASPAALVPVAAKTADGRTSWTRPMQGGQLYDEPGSTRAKLSRVLWRVGLEAFLPDGEIVVQTFQDQKTLRQGYGDMLFVPVRKIPFYPAKAQTLRPLFGILDPALVPDENP
jgi:hypothetical protein